MARSKRWGPKVFSRTASLPSTRGGRDSILDNPASKDRTDKIILEIVKELENLPIDPETGSIYRGSAKKILDKCIVLQPWLTRDMIHSKRNRMKQALQEKGAGTMEGDSTKKTNLEQLESFPKGGRKKGTTNAAIRQKKRKFNDVKNDIVSIWVDKTKRPSNCTLIAFIEQKQKEFGFDTGKPDHSVTVPMVESRMYRNRIQIEGPIGQRSPLYSIKPRLVMFLKLASNCNQEMTEAEILDFVNTYISGSKLEQEIIDWKLRNHVDWRNDYVETKLRPSKADVQSSWFKGFVKRWEEEISYPKSKNTAHYRKEHCTYAAFDLMYNKIYALLEQGGYARSLPVPVFYNEVGERCEYHEIYGKPVELEFLRPELELCADECGTNTNMSNDRLSGGNKCVHRNGTKILLPGCTSDTHFTTMGFTSLDGRPVCCVVIIQKKES